LLISLSFLILTHLVICQTFTSARDGVFDDDNTWVGGAAPNDKFGGSTVVNINHDVTFDQEINVEDNAVLNISGSGSLKNIAQNKKFKVVDNGTVNAVRDMIVGHFDVEDNGSFTIDGSFSSQELHIKDNSTSVFNGSVLAKKNFEVKDGGSITLNGPSVFEDGVDIKDDAIINTGANGVITAEKDVKIEDDATVNFEGNLIVDGDLEIKDDVSFTSNGTILVENDFLLKDDVSVTLNSDLRVNDDLEPGDDINLTINANAYIADDLKSSGDANITIGPNSIVQIVDVLDHDGATLTINGALIAQGLGNTNESVNDATINGSGLLQIGGVGIYNNGTISGSLDVCSGTGTSPFTGGGVSGGATICSNSGANFPIIPGAPLAIDLISFDATLNENKEVDLVWITSSELNNDYFTIERSNEDLNFIAIEHIPGEGTINEIKEYNYTDKEPIKGKSYYRLKQTDFDGKSETFDMVSVVFESEAEIEVVLYPNPSNGSDNIFLKVPSSEGENFNVLINDLLGRDFISDLTFIEQNDHTLIIIDFDKQLPKGYYLINIVIKGEIITKKLVVE
jgi:acetyltransferase-like isoleucine patch superfamily enzyme